ncbi:RNA polymerase sigma factor [Carbonactinospora thermoautotrophica]|uniref:RNA polymerase sigma factor n=1 Tax=Carbonactinospora thermoautotrophica TaxID=1469144 RepID=UPI00226E07D4|nr:hypothetical protein [Carbonactinospora thermoautotrophica]
MKARGLVTALLVGDYQGLIGLFDTYGDDLYDYCWTLLSVKEAIGVVLRDTLVIAYHRIGELSDPDLLTAWVYAVARNQCLCRELPAEPIRRLPRLPTDEPGPIARAAAGALPFRERDALELWVRHRLEDREIAAIHGVRVRRARAVRARAAVRLERLFWAYRSAWGHGACDRLRALLADWDGTVSAVEAGPVARHLRRCPACARGVGEESGVHGLWSAEPERAPGGYRAILLTEVRDWTRAARQEEIARRAGRFDRAGFPVPLDRRGWRGRPRRRRAAQ